MERGDEILTPDALEFVAELHGRFALEHAALMRRRAHRRPLGFLDGTRDVREGDWKVAGAPEPLRDRRVE
ncbi:malate synthase A, partial [Saccharothrix sp. MB29]|nr:malate synthase A [Saccharothrix sp. MB29]